MSDNCAAGVSGAKPLMVSLQYPENQQSGYSRSGGLLAGVVSRVLALVSARHEKRIAGLGVLASRLLCRIFRHGGRRACGGGWAPGCVSAPGPGGDVRRSFGRSASAGRGPEAPGPRFIKGTHNVEDSPESIAGLMSECHHERNEDHNTSASGPADGGGGSLCPLCGAVGQRADGGGAAGLPGCAFTHAAVRAAVASTCPCARCESARRGALRLPPGHSGALSLCRQAFTGSGGSAGLPVRPGGGLRASQPSRGAAQEKGEVNPGRGLGGDLSGEWVAVQRSPNP